LVASYNSLGIYLLYVIPMVFRVVVNDNRVIVCDRVQVKCFDKDLPEVREGTLGRTYKFGKKEKINLKEYAHF